jgi:alpha/beta superfamily hydrolase
MFPVVVLITGSGPQNRDEELMGHKPFLILSDYLTRKGIGVLRYDDRGTYASKGNFAKSTTFDFATDVESAVNYLKTRPEIDKKHIGLIGHSEGGIIAPMVAVKCKDVSFIVLMAGTGIPGGDILLLQQELIGRASGTKEEDLKKTADINREAYRIINSTSDTTKLKSELNKYFKLKIKEAPGAEIPKGTSEDELIKSQVGVITSPWMLNFIKYNPAPMLEKVKICRFLPVSTYRLLKMH